MKKTISFLAALMMIGSLVLAADLPVAEARTAVVKNGATYKLYYNGAQPMDVTISILDAGDNIVFREILKKVDGFVRPYNFSHLRAGDYTIEIRDANGARTEKIKYEEPSEAEFARVLKVSGSESKYILMISNKVPGAVTVRILDESDNVIYSQNENITGNFAKIYNMESLAGKGRFEITDANGNAKYIGY